MSWVQENGCKNKLANEQRVLRALSEAAKISLAKFPDSIEDDKKLLDDEETYPKFSNARTIVLMRYGEKVVLQSFITCANVCIPLLQMSQLERQEYLRENRFKIDTNTEIYIREVVERFQ